MKVAVSKDTRVRFNWHKNSHASTWLFLIPVLIHKRIQVFRRKCKKLFASTFAVSVLAKADVGKWLDKKL